MMDATSEDAVRRVRCDDCGRTVKRISRTVRGHRYCPACYKHEFRRRECPGCGNFALLPKSVPKAICRNCERTRPCVRGGCRRGEEGAQGLASDILRAGMQDLRARTFETRCRANSAKRADAGGVRKKAMRDLLPAVETRKRIALNRSTLSPMMGERFAAFGQWLESEIGPFSAGLKINRYLTFFQDVDKQWGDFPTADVLLSHFGAAALRRVLLPARWLEASGQLSIGKQAKAAESDRRRIAAKLVEFPKGSKERALLRGYHRVLAERLAAEKTSLRAVRLALTPAAALLSTDASKDLSPLEQKSLDVYLHGTPGQRSAVTGFVNYLRTHHDAELEMPEVSPGRSKSIQRKRLEDEMMALIRDAREEKDFLAQWLTLGLKHFHGIPRRTGRKLVRSEATQRTEGGYTIRFRKKDCYVPDPPAPAAVDLHS